MKIHHGPTEKIAIKIKVRGATVSNVIKRLKQTLKRAEKLEYQIEKLAIIFEN